MRRITTQILVGVLLALVAWIAYPGVRARVLAIEETPAVRGQRLALELGCMSCHGPGGVGGVANPGSEEGSVPAFTERTQMMYVKTTDDLRGYILDGAPQRKRDSPDYQAKMERAALRMPEYRGWVTDAQVDDLVAYLRAASDQVRPDEALAKAGGDVAMANGCFACHGPLGAGGVANPGAFKGYIPGFWGDDFDDLVRDDGELRQWIEKGRIARIAEHPIGRYFFGRQRIKMPAYERFLKPDEIDALIAYVRWIRAGAWRPLIR